MCASKFSRAERRGRPKQDCRDPFLDQEGRDPSLERRGASAGVSKLRRLSDLIEEYLARRKDQIAPKTLKIERDLLEGVLGRTLGDRLLAQFEPVDYGKSIGDYAACLRAGG